MNTQQAAELVVKFLKKNPDSTKAAISEATGVKGIVLTNVFKKLTNEGSLMEAEGEEGKMYSITEQPVAEETQVEEEETTDHTPAKGRNNQKFRFNGQEYGKGPLVREVVRQYVEDHKPTIKQLKEAFPDELLKRFGVFQDEDTARSIQGARDRYFWKEEHQIKVKGKIIVVCNQWTSETLRPFLAQAKALGYKIK
ncbi:MAG: hypothetical protein JST83_05340 [Bacteroidetes bacterium]|nr:hypothetical protein [Bacteroidota bacterium]